MTQFRLGPLLVLRLISDLGEEYISSADLGEIVVHFVYYQFYTIQFPIIIIHFIRHCFPEQSDSLSKLCNVFISQMFLCLLSVIMLAVMIYTVADDQCLSVNTQEPQTGHRCVTASESYATIPNVHLHLCTHICMQRGNCSVINYNHVKHYCQLTSDYCQKIVKDSDFTVTDIPCLQWVASDENIVDHMHIPCGPMSNYFVSRLVYGSDIRVGIWYRSKGFTDVWANRTSKIWYRSKNTELLQMMPWCSAKWVPFITGDHILPGAIVGGYLGDPPVETYIIYAHRKLCGYYNPVTRMGYVPYKQPVASTKMKILVIQGK